MGENSAMKAKDICKLVDSAYGRSGNEELVHKLKMTLEKKEKLIF